MQEPNDRYLKQSSDRCTAQVQDGRFCDAVSVPDAPFPICPTHARQAFEFGTQLIGSRKRLGERIDAAIIGEFFGPSSWLVERPMKVARPCVYFLKIGDHIKIGTSKDFTVRLRGYPPTAKVLHVENRSDAQQFERRCHQHFKDHLAAGFEWFADVPAIRKFIADLKEGVCPI